MSASPREALLMALYNALPELATQDLDVERYYVRRSEDDQHDAIANLRQQLLWSERPNQTFLFSGLRGAGKTTELLKLIKTLRSEGVAAYYCDAGRYLNLNDPALELQELLLAVMAGFAEAAQAELGEQTRSLWDSLWETLRRDVRLDAKFELPVGPVSVSARLADQPNFRDELRRVVRESNAFYEQAARFGNELAAKLKANRGAQKLVLVVDSLENLSAPSGEEGTLFASLKSLYFHQPARLKFEQFSVIYSAPPYLQAVLPNVASGFSHAVTLTNFKVQLRPVDEIPPRPSAAGLARMRELLTRRMPNWSEIADAQVVDRLAWMSGGNVRRFFALLRTFARKLGLNQDALPILDPKHLAVEQALSEAAQPLQWLNAQDRRWLGYFNQSSEPPAARIDRIETDLPSIIRLFDHSLVLDYQNGELWYQLPPLVRERVFPDDE